MDTPNDGVNSAQSLHKSALSELSTLGRVSHRLALTSAGESLEKVLVLLLPRLLNRIGSNHKRTAELTKAEISTRNSLRTEAETSLKKVYDKIHAKLVEILSDIIKRTRADCNCKLPCESILALLHDDATQKAYTATQVDPFTLNLSLTFLTLGLPRCETEEVEHILPCLISMVGAHSNISSLKSPARKNQSYQVGQLLVRAIEIVVTRNRQSMKKKGVVSLCEESDNFVARAQKVCATDHVAGAAVYDLMLDILLYQPSAGGGNLPPPGLSQSGNERLRSGASTVAKDWHAEFTPSSRLRDLKLAILDFVSPCRRWSIFEGSTRTRNNDKKDDAMSLAINEHEQMKGIARGVALLVLASGDPHPDICERATQYLKSHMDSLRNVNTFNRNGSRREKQGTPPHASQFLLGDPIALCFELLSLVNGDIVVENVLSKTNMQYDTTSLGICHTISSGEAVGVGRNVIMLTKRRMVSDLTVTPSLVFIGNNIMDDIPRIFSFFMGKEQSLEKCVEGAYCIGMLLHMASKRYLGTGTVASGPSATSSRGNPVIAASSALNSVCIRLVALYDAVWKVQKNDETEMRKLQNLLAAILETVCSVVASPSLSHSASAAHQVMVETRDSCYGIICTISRSRFALANDCRLFSCGKNTSDNTGDISTETASVLFQCLAFEGENLRQRASAALDALLKGYRVICNNKEDNSTSVVSQSNEVVDTANPWAESVENKPEQKKSGSNKSAGLRKPLLHLLWKAALNTKSKSSRVAAVRWANDLLKPLDLENACHILCFLSGDTDTVTASIAREGLGIGNQDDSDDVLPDFNDIVSTLFSKRSHSLRPGFLQFSPRGQGTTFRFALKCLFCDLYGGEDVAIEKLLSVLCETMFKFCPLDNNSFPHQGSDMIDLLDECSISIAGCLATSQFARKKIVERSFSFQIAHITSLSLESNSSKSRRYLSEAYGHIMEDRDILSFSVSPDGNFSAKVWDEKTFILSNLALCAKKLDDMHTHLFIAGQIHGAALLGARCVRALRLSPCNKSSSDFMTNNGCSWIFASKLLSALGRGLLQTDEVIGNACAQGLSISLSHDELDAPYLNEKLYEGTAVALTKLKSALKKFGNGDDTNPTRVSFLAEATGVVLAASASATGSDNISTARIQCVNELFALFGSSSSRKDEAISLIAGESISMYGDAYSPVGAVWTEPSLKAPNEYEEAFAAKLPPHKQVVYIMLQREMKTSSPLKRNSCAPAMLAFVGHAARMVNSRPETLRRAFIQVMLTHLPKFQFAFLTLLADPKSKQLARESCCLGLAACRGLSLANTCEANGDDQHAAMNDRLLKVFGQTTNYGGSAMMETRSQNVERLRRENRSDTLGSSSNMMEEFGIETEVGGASGLGEAALGAYREMAEAAVSLSRPDILYSLMTLSVTHPIWLSSEFRDRYSTFSLLGKDSVASGSNVIEIRKALRPHFATLIPRLLRACHDPNRETREQMTALWLGVTGGGVEARSAITENLLTTIDVLIDDATNKLWRARVGACGALSEVIVGRSWKGIGGGGAIFEVERDNIKGLESAGSRLLHLFRVTTRALDDVRTSVRESGGRLARSLRSLVVRLCDPASSEVSSDQVFVSDCDYSVEIAQSTKAAASTVLTWLVKDGLDLPCAEAAGFSVSCLLGVVEVSGATTLQPVLPEIIGSLLMAMSGLEPAALNYLQLRASGQESNESDNGSSYETLERLRLQLARSGPISEALTKCLDVMKFISLSSQKQVISHVDHALRCGAGFASRTAAADAVSTLCNTCPLAFKFSGNSTMNPTVRLLRALYFASERERGVGAREKMVHALGNLAQLAPGTSVRSLAIRACNRYKSATGSNDDPVVRKAAAAALRAIAVRASKQFSDGGSNDIWCQCVLPMAFLGRKDEDISALWMDVWEEGGQAINSKLTKEDSSVGINLQEKLLPYLSKICIDALNDVSWSRRVTACKALAELAETNILSPGSESLSGQAGYSVRAERRAKASYETLSACVRLLLKSRLWNGKEHLLQTTTKIAGKWTSRNNDKNHLSDNYNPISVKNISWKDLFLNDSYFEGNDTEHATEEINIEEQKIIPVNDEGSHVNDCRLDFDEGDRLLNSDEKDWEPSMSSNTTKNNEAKPICFTGLCRALLDQGIPSKTYENIEVDTLLYRSTALKCLAELVQSTNIANNQYLYRMISPTLFKLVQNADEASAPSASSEVTPPLLVARSIDIISCTLWRGIGEVSEHEFEDIMMLATLFCGNCSARQGAWTVKEASAGALTALSLQMVHASLRKIATIETLIKAACLCLKDRKFWRVRVAGLKILVALCSRAGGRQNLQYGADSAKVSRKAEETKETQQLILEALLPHKEIILDISRSSLSDNESKVTAIASEICATISFWP